MSAIKRRAKKLLKGNSLEASIRRLLKGRDSLNRLAAERRIRTAIQRTPRPKSVLFFTTAKCASTFTHRLLNFIGSRSNLDYFDYEMAIYKMGDETNIVDPFEFMAAKHEMLFVESGEIYGPLRRAFSFKGQERYRHIFFLRDPRDVAVSAYFSFGFSHPLPPNRKVGELFLRDRAQIQREGIDEFCLRASKEWIIRTYREYARFKDKAHWSAFFSYDDYREDPASFLAALLDTLEITGVTAEGVEELARMASPVRAEPLDGKLVHRRSGESRQFLKELKLETIRRLNDDMHEILEYWGFEKSD